MPDCDTSRITLVGAGRMGKALLRGWLASGIKASSIDVVEKSPSDDLLGLARSHDLRIYSIPIAHAPSGALVLAIKSQSLEAAAPTLLPLLRPDTVVVSIMAGRTCADIARHFAGTRAIVRAMPNLAAAVASSATVAVATAECTRQQLALARGLLESVGSLEWLNDEALVDVATAVGGSGPAYVLYLCECLAEAGAQAGLPAAVARRLARATVEGTGLLLRRNVEQPTELRAQVSSPSGTTEAALRALVTGKFQALISRAVRAAVRRARQLGDASR